MPASHTGMPDSELQLCFWVYLPTNACPERQQVMAEILAALTRKTWIGFHLGSWALTIVDIWGDELRAGSSLCLSNEINNN